MSESSIEPSTLVLASASPRRAELLRQIGLKFIVRPTDIDETRLSNEQPIAYVQRMAVEKSLRGQAQSTAATELVLGADTAVVLGEQVLGKPDSEAHAISLLTALGGKRHQVLTAVALTDGKRTEVRLNATAVEMRVISEQEARAYWLTGEPADKAGGYGIQGHGALFISRIEGSYSGVMGLPLYETADLLAAFGYRVASLP